MKPKNVVFLLPITLLILAPLVAKADQWDQKTTFTFNEPVEIPGQVLSPGTYVFKLADSSSDRDIVEVFDKGEDHLFGIFLAVPDYRLKPAGKPIIMFEERAADVPEAIKAWFYPAENYGHAFVYPKMKAIELAKANRDTVPSMPDELGAQTTQPAKTMNAPSVRALKNASLRAERPTGEEVTVSVGLHPSASERNYFETK